jgi:arylsulfatase A-like enzyme
LTASNSTPHDAAPAPIPLSARAASVLFASAVLAALDTAWMRAEQSHWPLGAGAFVQALALWGVFAVLAQLPAAAFDRWLLPRLSPGRERAHLARVALRSLAWTALPVVVHSLVDDYTALGGDLSGLAQPRPWIEVAVAFVALIAFVRIGGSLAARWSPARTLAPLSLVALASGFLLDFHTDEAASRAGDGARRPNVLLLVWDTARAQNTTPYGYSRDTTPNLARVAAESLRFENARSASVYTLSSHISMLTGVHPSHHGARLMRRRFNPLSVPNVARSLREAGYRTGGFVGTDVLRAPSGVSHAFERYSDRVDPWVSYTHAWALVHDVQALCAKLVPALRFNDLPHWFQDYQRPADEVLREVLEWIESDDPRPWFCFVNLYDVHWPYLPHEEALERFDEPYDGIVDGYSERGDRVHAQPGYAMSASDHARLVTLYDSELFELDGKVEAFLGRLDLARTALVLTSDHGEAFGEGGRLEHSDILECQVRVPLLVRAAGGGEGRVVTAPASGVDVAPTLLQLAGLAPPKEMLGRGLTALEDGARAILVEHRDLPRADRTQIALYDAPFKLVRHGAAPNYTWKLHDLRTDREGLVDVAAEHPEVVARLRAALESYRSGWTPQDGQDAGPGGGADMRGLRALGYLGGENP